MSKNFLGALANQLSSNFSIGENVNHTLDLGDITGETENIKKYGALGDYASKIDQSAERKYVEQGYLRRDPYNVISKEFDVLFQEPSASILIKKKMFSSLSENFRSDYMDNDEKIYYKAIRVLFQNKCEQIAALEKLSKIQQVSNMVGQLDDQMVPLIITLTDIFTYGFGQGTNYWSSMGVSNPFNNAPEVNKLVSVVNQLRKIYAFNSPNKTTTWITDNTNMFKPIFGQGTGVIEITNFTNLSTTVTTTLDGNNFNFSIEDPYEAMVITEYDIEKAIADSTNAFFNHKTYQLGKDSSDKLIVDLQNRLNRFRAKRGASQITIKINPDTLLGKRVRAIIDKSGLEIVFNYNAGKGMIAGGVFTKNVEVDEGYLKGGEIAGIEGLNNQSLVFSGGNPNDVSSYHKSYDSELTLFDRLITAIFNKLSFEANAVGQFQTYNKNTNYVRKKLRFDFLGKLIIQPMDVVHIFLSSKTRHDDRLMTGINNMFSGVSVLQNLNKTLTDLKNSVDAVFNPAANINFQVEKSIFVGKDFPDQLWATIRNQFVQEKEGTHVFAGLVKTASEKYSGGKYTVNVSGSDNSEYFNKGVVNFNPGADNFNGQIFDPLTPFKSSFDDITYNFKSDVPELLEENKARLVVQPGEAPLLRKKLGPSSGKPATEATLLEDHKIENKLNVSSRICYAPDGLLYQWKHGIGIFTKSGSSIDFNDPDLIGKQSITKQPFAGQDIMNVLSLLITGQPYNFATYWNTVRQFDTTGSKDAQNGKPESFYSELKQNLQQNNLLWGHFIPFKSLSIDDESYKRIINTQATIINNNADIDNKLRKLSDVQNSLRFLGAAKALQNRDSLDDKAKKLAEEADRISKDINLTLQNECYTKDSSIYENGKDIVYDYDNFINKDNKNLNDANSSRLIRRQVNFLTRRMSYNIKANEDKNLFIVDDFYDKDYDIIAFEKTFKNQMELFTNSFETVKDRINTVARLLQLEVFCDTQGHLRVRPAQYNRMPSSVFHRMMFLKQSVGVQYFPQFLNNIFTDNIDAIRKQIEVVEDMIRLDGAVLGYQDDNSIRQYLLTNDFYFISNEDSGEITDITKIINSANPEKNKEYLSFAVSMTNIENQNKIKNIFNTSVRAATILQALTDKKLANASFGIFDIKQYNSSTRIAKLIQRIENNSGQKIKQDNYISTNPLTSSNPEQLNNYNIDVFKTTNEMSEKVAERQKLLKIYYDTIKNAVDFKSLDSNQSLSTKLLMPGSMANQNVPQIFEHMLEDETYDDYGVGSGSRYVIKRAQIIDLNISENEPDMSYVSISGMFTDYDLPTPEGFNSVFPQDGNALTTAVGVDYDLWRNYGLKMGANIKLPFLSDPQSQCAPFASMLLSKERKNILRGSITITGNEYMQPGEVIYIEDRNMLFYVNSVSHNFTFGGNFTTSLQLSYGHSPGEYIPTPLDMIGKIIYKNRDNGSIMIQRQSSNRDELSLGTVLRIENTQDIFAPDVLEPITAANIKAIQNIAFSAAKNNYTISNDQKVIIELRIYYDDKQKDNNLLMAAEKLKGILTKNGGVGMPIDSGKRGNILPTFEKDQVVINEINLNNSTISPSQKAHDAASNLTKIKTGSSTDIISQGENGTQTIYVASKHRNMLYQYVIDCYITIKPIETNKTVK